MAVIYDTPGQDLFPGEGPAGQGDRGLGEDVVAVIKAHPDYMTGKGLTDHYEFIAQAYFMVATALKTGNARQGPLFDKSIEYMVEMAGGDSEAHLAGTPVHHGALLLQGLERRLRQV